MFCHSWLRGDKPLHIITQSSIVRIDCQNKSSSFVHTYMYTYIHTYISRRASNKKANIIFIYTFLHTYLSSNRTSNKKADIMSLLAPPPPPLPVRMMVVRLFLQPTIRVDSIGSCCSACSGRGGCRAFSFDKGLGLCYMKNCGTPNEPGPSSTARSIASGIKSGNAAV